MLLGPITDLLTMSGIKPNLRHIGFPTLFSRCTAAISPVSTRCSIRLAMRRLDEPRHDCVKASLGVSRLYGIQACQGSALEASMLLTAAMAAVLPALLSVSVPCGLIMKAMISSLYTITNGVSRAFCQESPLSIV